MKKKLTVLWTNLHFSTQIHIAFFSIFIIPFLIICIVVSFYFKSTLQAKTVNYMESNLKQAVRSISESLQLYENSAFQTIFSPDFTERLTRLNEGNFSEYVYARQDILDYFRTLASYYAPIHSMALKSQGKIIWYGRLENDNNLYGAYNPFLLDEEPDQLMISGADKWAHTSFFSGLTRKQYHMATYQQKCIDYNRNNVMGTYLLNIDLSSFQNILEEAAIAETQTDNYLFMMDRYGTVFYALDEDLIGSDFYKAFKLQDPYGFQSGNPSPGTHKNSELILVKAPIPNTDWYLVDALNQSYANREVNLALPLLLFFALFLLFTVSLAVSWISKSMSKSIREIVNTMQKVETGALTVKVPNDSKNEISVIGRQFNDMMDTIQNQISTIKTITERKKEAEISALENQIDPHFLYNTLDSINWLAIDNEEPEISSMLCNLSALMRYRIKRSNAMVSMEEDLSYLEKYLILQKYRYSDNFNYIIELDPALKQCMVHKLLFQPFVENSLIHGFGETDHGGLLKLAISSQDQEHIKFYISDNGKGMEQEQLDRILRASGDSGNHIGTANVRNRMELYYGKDFSIKGVSRPGWGTEITIVIPKAMQEERKDCLEYTDCRG